jgi:hypothetical protein
MGALVSQFPNIEAAREANVDWPVNSANTFATTLATRLEGGVHFRFIFVSGILSSTEFEKRLFFLQDSRRFKVRFQTPLCML